MVLWSSGPLGKIVILRGTSRTLSGPVVYFLDQCIFVKIYFMVLWSSGPLGKIVIFRGTSKTLSGTVVHLERAFLSKFQC